MNGELRLTILYEDAGDGWVTAQVAEVPGAVKRTDLERHLRDHGCHFVGEGGQHAKWRGPGRLRDFLKWK